MLEGIKSKGDLDNAKPKLEKIGARIKAMSERAQKLTPEERKALESEAQTASAKSRGRVDTEMKRISSTLGFETMIGIVEAMKIAPGEKPF